MLNSIKKYFKRLKEEPPGDFDPHLKVHGAAGDNLYDPGPQKIIPEMWTGVDLDGTLARWDSGSSIAKIGPPVPAMLQLVRKMINNGIRVKIFTARAQDPEQLPMIRKWLKKNGLPDLEITNVKDYYMQRLYDDRCVQIEKNTGRRVVG